MLPWALAPQPKAVMRPGLLLADSMRLTAHGASPRIDLGDLCVAQVSACRSLRRAGSRKRLVFEARPSRRHAFFSLGSWFHCDLRCYIAMWA